jgi:2-polyprenyl-3-methyl-5-hydroxy-6-metoxy-1,4-benzoquinol methylase
MDSFVFLDVCVACNSKNLFQTLDLGKQPLANSYTVGNNPLTSYPLALYTCLDCFHSQLSASVKPSLLFSNYLYVSGTSNSLKKYFLDLKNLIIELCGTQGKILDVGSNDGTFLSVFEDTDWKCIGVDPAINLVSQASERGVLSIASFFDLRLSNFLAKDFDVVVAMNVFAHTSNPLEMLLAMKAIIKDDGILLIQTSQANMFEGYQFDTVYHEHISFFNVKSMKSLLQRAGLQLKDVLITNIHGDSYLWIIGKTDTQVQELHREIYEQQARLYSQEKYENFASKCLEIKERFISLVSQYRNSGFSIAVYGSAAKGNTFLNFAKIEIDAIFDDTPLKIGKHSPVQNVMVKNPEEMRLLPGPYLFIIPAWNFREEILGRIRKLRAESSGDIYLTYFPDFNIGKIQL